MKHTLKAWLKRYSLTADESDFKAVVESFGSVTPEGIIKELVAEGLELKTETVLDVVQRYNRKCAELLLRGYNVNTGIVQMRPVIRGVFRDKTWNPAQNRVRAAVTQSAELRAVIAGANVEILGEHPGALSLFNITDGRTRKTDGTLSRGFTAEIKGTFIKIAGNEEECGIYFRNTATGVETKLEDQYIVVNNPSLVMILVPPTIDLGTYELRITTQFGRNSNTRHARTASLPYTVEVG